MSFAIVTDSTCDLPKTLTKAHQIFVVPQYVNFGIESFQDGKTIEFDDFYAKLATTTTHPTTSQPTVGDFVEYYKLAKTETDADEVLAIVVSSEVSGTYNSAVQAAEMVDFPVEVVDSRITSIAMGFLCLDAAEARDAGKSFRETLALIHGAIDKVQIYVTVATLEYLQRSGRITGTAKLFGEALKIKPILCAVDGKVEPVDRVRTSKKALARLVELANQSIDGHTIKRLGILEAHAPEEVDQLQSRLMGWIDGQIDVFRAGATVGAHAGPGLYGLAYELV